MREKVSRQSVFCFVWYFVSRDGSQSHFVDWLHPSAAERSLSQHLFLASVEGSLPVHGQTCMRGIRSKADVIFWRGETVGLWCAAAEGRETAGYLGCWPAAGWNDISVCQDVKHTHMRCRSEIKLLTGDTLQPECFKCANNASPAKSLEEAVFSLPFYNYDSLIPPRSTSAPPPSRLLFGDCIAWGGRCVFSLAVLEGAAAAPFLVFSRSLSY